jgi:hypothetical protein
VTRRRVRAAWTLFLLICFAAADSSTVRADEDRATPSSRGGRAAAVAAVVRERAVAHDVSPWLLEALVRCEAGPGFDPEVIGDHGHSHGLAQLSDLPTGLLAHFHAQGFITAYDAWEAADYLARVASGEWAGEGVTLKRWSCWWVVTR